MSGGGYSPSGMKHRIIACDPGLEGSLKALYEASFVSASTMLHYRRNGDTDQWALDLRLGLSRHEVLLPIAREVGRLVSSKGASQIVGRGYGSAFLVGGVIATRPNMTGGIIREAAKPYGFRKLIEGGVTSRRPVFLVDDVLSSGRSAEEALIVLHECGFAVAGLIVIFRYGWRKSAERLAKYQLPVYPLATLFPEQARGADRDPVVET